MAVEQIDIDDQMQECIDTCFDVAEVCDWCADRCIAAGNEELIRCIQLCRDTADVATQCARHCSRDSAFYQQIAGVCADACEECADECEQHDMDATQACVDVLRDCAELCREMA